MLCAVERIVPAEIGIRRKEMMKINEGQSALPREIPVNPEKETPMEKFGMLEE